MGLYEKIKDLRNAHDNNRLVIFVGSGVSNNSNIPTWNQLIIEFAKKLVYDKCRVCSLKEHIEMNCPKEDCPERFNFSQDEYLKIPQYYYNKDKGGYNQLILDTLKCEEATPNPIHNVIMNLFPKHIITTNYDKLIENTNSPNKLLYSVINKDKDFLKDEKSSYIIKMHGDIDNPDTIVLKEDDYLNYGQKHPFIETFIKSLLIDHTFLFVGYSLNDYNLKLILSWVEFFAKEKGDNEYSRTKHYIIQTDMVSDFEEQYFNANNLFLLKTTDLPDEVIKKSEHLNLTGKGKKTYSVLDFILDESMDYLVEPLEDLLYQKCMIFDDFKCISFQDLKSVYYFGSVEKVDEVLLFYNEEKYHKIKAVLLSDEEMQTYIKKTFVKANIYGISNRKNDQIEIKVFKVPQTLDDKLFTLYLDNEYQKILDNIDSLENDEMLEAYYYHLIKPNASNCVSKLDEIGNRIVCNDRLKDLVVHKWNLYMTQIMQFKEAKNEYEEFKRLMKNIPVNKQKAYGFIDDISNDMIKNRIIINKLLTEHEDHYITRKLDILNNRLGRISEIKAYAYDFYFYFKYNNLMIDYLANTKRYFEPYVRAILCTYSSKKEKSKKYIPGLEPNLSEYHMNSVDLDIMIKHTNLKMLKSWISNYQVKNIIINNNVDIMGKFKNLCNSAKLYGPVNEYLYSQIMSFIYILTKFNMELDNKKSFIEILNNLLIENSDIIISAYIEIEETISYLQDEHIEPLHVTLNCLLKVDSIKMINKKYPGRLQYTLKHLRKYSDDKIEKKIDELINSLDNANERLAMINTLRYLFNDEQNEKYFKLVYATLNLVYPRDLFWYLLDGQIVFNDNIRERFIAFIERTKVKKVNNPGAKEIPDLLTETINMCINLHLLNIWDDINNLADYVDYSDYLAFIIEPRGFDPKKIDTSHYMWINILFNNKYRKQLQPNGIEIVKSDITKAVVDGYATEDQRKLLYKYFLTERELYNM